VQEPAPASRACGEWEAKAMARSQVLHQAEAACGAQLWGEKVEVGGGRAGGQELTSMGPLPLPAYWTDGQVEKQTHGQADCKRKEQDAGVPLLLHNKKCHRHHQNGKGVGKGPLSAEGDRGRGEHQFCPARGGSRNGRAEAGGRWAPKPPAHSVRGELPE
jgi:hypothetical protein